VLRDFSWRTSRGKVNLEELGLHGSSILRTVQSVLLQRGCFVLVIPHVTETRVIKIGPDQQNSEPSSELQSSHWSPKHYKIQQAYTQFRVVQTPFT